ncbi:MAG: heat-inducible transcription repressor HrcA [Nitrospirae bacterium CG_4_10_14_0_8_um_filter_41_23]|nr:MAG: heat-inducible transcription repressor HrcA [Nitrospirae bacterium CG11_big_fil_rev_8_21_14_0_20_41_14]PIV41121.1 MAG: heat-inducible transcription repressor HrcA [Nitrospirae bacterium CG02_land_8_20_14_3_00_41_53]PIW88116.1 MAG: heat-inducible transcription repressor HrcA [Nitrospirae bacterium CG_4_8_14_3_um_filter_41_47]PIY87381.1 MAG: heat-inducible transcription repressor HrcA [Nitrospirae bacterium CG_4_10_14_0_8_um_filter_41_23]PJA79712.1 MAG: heat-inducible transcription repres
MQMMEERSKKVLCAVVQSYINFPDPVGSMLVTKRYSFGLSPATIRNIMADLEDMGFLAQPHTSAGRVPTDRGYRFYVDLLVAEKDYYTNMEILQEIYKRLEALRNNIDVFLGETTRTLSKLSHYLGVAMSPRLDMTTLKRIELLKYRADKIAAILFTDEGLIKNKVVSLDSEISQKDLNRITGYLNSEFSGHTFDEIRFKVIKEMSKEKIRCDTLISRAMKICREALSFSHNDLFVSGLSEVFDLPDFADLKKIRELSRAIEDKHTIIELLDSLSEFDGLQIIIGSENSMDEMKKLSVVVSTCKEGYRPIGVVGIIGPTRMNYEKAIYIVDNTAKFITKMLSGR